MTAHLMACVYQKKERRCADVFQAIVTQIAASHYALVEMSVPATANVLRWTCVNATTATRKQIAVAFRVSSISSAQVMGVVCHLINVPVTRSGVALLARFLIARGSTTVPMLSRGLVLAQTCACAALNMMKMTAVY
jgi:hypothetical protein